MISVGGFSGPALVLLVAMLLDQTVGEYPNRLHPPAWMGKVAGWLQRGAPRTGGTRQLVYGALVALTVPALFGAGALLIEWLNVPPLAELALAVLVLKASFALEAAGHAAA